MKTMELTVAHEKIVVEIRCDACGSNYRQTLTRKDAADALFGFAFFRCGACGKYDGRAIVRDSLAMPAMPRSEQDEDVPQQPKPLTLMEIEKMLVTLTTMVETHEKALSFGADVDPRPVTLSDGDVRRVAEALVRDHSDAVTSIVAEALTEIRDRERLALARLQERLVER